MLLVNVWKANEKQKHKNYANIVKFSNTTQSKKKRGNNDQTMFLIQETKNSKQSAMKH